MLTSNSYLHYKFIFFSKFSDILLEAKADLTAIKSVSKDTVLHCFLKQDQDLNVDYLKILLNQKDENLDQQIKSIINKKDINGQTALHIAAQRQEQINYRTGTDQENNCWLLIKLKPKTSNLHMCVLSYDNLPESV